MTRTEVVPDDYTYPSVIKACGREFKLREGRMLHGSAMKVGFDDCLVVGSALVDFYGKCKDVEGARKVFDEISDRNVVSWTALVDGYVNIGNMIEAKKVFDEMPLRNELSWNVLIKGFVKMGDLKSARELFDRMPQRSVVSYTAMIDGYAKTGDMASARFLFDQAPVRDIVAWSTLISGYVQNGQPNEAVKIFAEMDAKRVKPDEYIMVSLMSACSQLGNLDLAKWVDSYLDKCSIDVQQPHVAAALVDMNAKCGNMKRAMQLFEEAPRRDIVSYCSMIQGLSLHGCGAQAVGLFQRMLDEEGLIPDNVAFTVILAACSHAGLIDEGVHYFETMRNVYSIAPSPDHYACMVDLLSRAGRLKEAYELIKSMPMETYASAWGGILGGCRLYCDIELGEVVAKRLLELEPENGGNYVLLSNIYAAADRWLDVSLVRNKMKERGVRKVIGCSWV